MSGTRSVLSATAVRSQYGLVKDGRSIEAILVVFSSPDRCDLQACCFVRAPT